MPLTPDNARAARNYLGLSQAKAAEESGLPAHKIKRFEAGNYIPDEAFLNDLRSFFERGGYEFPDTQKPGARAKAAGKVFPAGVVGGTEENQGSTEGKRPQKTEVHHMRIAMTDDATIGRIMDVIEENEEAAEQLLQQPVEKGFFGGLTEESQGRHVEALNRLAENGRLFAVLFGRTIGGNPKPEILKGDEQPATHADLLHKRQADANLYALAADAEARARRKRAKPASTLLGAVFG
jgi:transcriptional regulator with XRE-family HTH domain